MWAKEGCVLSVIGKREPTDSDTNIPQVDYWIFDVSDKQKMFSKLDEIVGKNGKIDSLVLLQRYRGKENDWEGEFETSVTATRNIIEKLEEHFYEEGDKSIVVVSSVIGSFVASGQMLSYHVAKAALEAMVRFYAVELGSKKGIRCNSVSPFTVLKEESCDFYLKNKGLCELYKEIVPLGRMGTAEEVANIIKFLCSADSSFVNGQNIVIDGGLSLIWQESLARNIKSL
jgi:NAD(P)-dependent dehydrogenase (short-subunit alcohol dehydrogenase family)